MEGMRNHLVVASLVFGTTKSGNAFSMVHEFNRDPFPIYTYCQWTPQYRTVVPFKSLTCLLLDKEKQFVAFGYDAEDRYEELVINEEHTNYYFFDRFTRSLHNNESVTRDMVLKDKTGKRCSAVEVFTLSIKAFVDHLMNELKKRITWLRGDEIKWVLTVPAAWTDSGKQLMRESAEKAGLHAENVLLITEAEAAFTYFHYMPTTRLQGFKPGIMIKEPGTKSMIVDLGDMTADITVLQANYNGGTADNTVHEKATNGQLTELCRATGNDCGGTSIDARFFKVLQEIAGEKVISELKEKDPFFYLDLVREFGAVKRTVETGKETKFHCLSLPTAALDNYCKKFEGKSLQSSIDSSSYVDKITLRGNKLRCKADFMIELYTPRIDSIITLMKNTLSNSSTNGVSNILMVGGFSNCPMMTEAVQKAFPGKRIIISDMPEWSILQGAVLFGHRPDYIRSVKCDSLDDDDDDDDGCIGK